MSKLHQQQCETLKADAPHVSDEELAELINEIPEWQTIVEDNIMKLRREFKFKNFKLALAFSNQVGALAEEHGHHPAILTEWGKVTITWWSHELGGLHKNDFILAAKTDQINL